MYRLPAVGFLDVASSLRESSPRPETISGRTTVECVAREPGADPRDTVRRSMHHVLDSQQALMLVRQRFLMLSAVVLSAGLFAALPATAAESCPPLLNHSFPSLQDQKPQSLCQWQGKVLLVVNTASYCGFTSQYDGLEQLYARLRERGLVVVGFPSNDFGEQEPGSNREIAEFCRLTYGVQFPMFAKATVVGKNASPFYAQLARATGDAPQWNFHKYLIDRSGTRVLSFGSRVKPDDRELLARIDEFLGK
jgi:glutathione peroxidase